MADALGLPLVEELDTALSPLELFECIKDEGGSFFLDSAMDLPKLGLYSLMGYAPFLTLVSRGDEITVKKADGEFRLKGDPFEVLGQYLESYRLGKTDFNLPCYGGAVGYLSYDLGRFVERLPAKAIDDLQLPESCLGFYDIMLTYDHQAKRAFLVSTGFPETSQNVRMARATERLAEFKAQLKKFAGRSLPVCNSRLMAVLKSNFTHKAYIRAVEKARQFIIEGDIFEVNLSQRYEAEIAISPFELYRRLRKINPAPFAAYLNCGDIVIAGSSPERFLRLQGDRVETRPIKGTIRRGKNAEEDKANSAWLLNSVKDLAENMMIVDLERNDLGRVCRTGTINVTEFASLEQFPTVFHLTSTVVGRLRADATRIDLLKATFPGGSITGAPKIRAMEIIEELEPTRRSVYTGSIGYFSFAGDLDLNIVIRTFLIKGKRAYFQLGGAVVYDSDPEAEYQETLDKGRALFKALNDEIRVKE